MTKQNTTYLEQSEHLLKEFEKQREPERLREAALSMQNIDLTQEENESRLLMRAKCLTIWFKILILFDFNYEPGFDLNDIPPKRVTPPVPLNPYEADTTPLTGKSKEQFETAQQQHSEKVNHYRMQVHLSRLKDFIPPAVIQFINSQFTSSLTDRAELKTAIEKQIKNTGRKTELLKLTES